MMWTKSCELVIITNWNLSGHFVIAPVNKRLEICRVFLGNLTEPLTPRERKEVKKKANGYFPLRHSRVSLPNKD